MGFLTSKDAPRWLPEFSNQSAETSAAQLSQLPERRRNKAAATVLYTTKARPAELTEQVKLFDIIAAMPGVAAHHRANALIARTHKASELTDVALLKDGMDRLRDLKPVIDDLPYSDDIRQDRCHVGFSRLYVGLNAALMLQDKALLAQLSEETAAFCEVQLQRSLRPAFYRTSANAMRCLAFCVIAPRGTARANLVPLAQNVFSRALNVRQQTTAKARTVSTGIPMADSEFMRTATLSQLLTDFDAGSGADAHALSQQIGRLAVAQRTPAQFQALLSAWETLSQQP
ncbi:MULTISPECIES: hypothetical protein [unclassified Marinovum]